MKRIIFLMVFCWSSLALTSFAQEICNNGIDDDNDGRIDCFDNQCANNIACDGSYIGNDALCEAKPSQFPEFRMTLDWASPNRVTNHLNRMSIGDLDRDGIPEVVVTNIEDNDGSRGVYVLNGSNGTIKFSNKSLPFTVDREVVIGNINDDNCAEIFLTGTDNGDRYIYAYNCDLATQLWRSQVLSSDPGLFGLADFNGDGQVEIYFRDMILNAHTGAHIADSPLGFTTLTGSPVAVDIVGDENLELVSGLRIFTVNIGAGTITEHSSRTEYFVRNLDGSHTSVADYNLDGNLDIIATGSTNGTNENTTVFFWDVTNNTLRTYSDPLGGNFTIQNCGGGTGFSTGEYYKNGWHRGTGRVNLADADGDGLMNAVYVSGKFLYALDENLDLLWKKTVSEETSGYTGCSMFDFNGDGQTEIVYRDERTLYIINGQDGSTYTSQTCISRTARDYPIVADVDADGQSELCVTCGFDNQLALDNFCDIEYSENSHVRVYKTDLEPWVPSRRLWNQNAYFNVNVNDDLTIPRRQQKTQTVFSLTGCDPLNPRPTRPLNSFLNQSPFLNSLGCPKYASPDLSYLDNSLVVNPPTCPNQNFTVSFTIENLGDVPVTGNVPITFYKGDPLLPGAIRLNTVTANMTNFAPGSQFNVTNATVNGDGSNFTLFIAINDSGTTVPSPISFPNTNFLECDYDNIISVNVAPLPVAITALKVQDNIKCVGSVTPNNGAVRAFIQVGAVQNTTDYNFFWSNGNAVISPPSFTGATYTSLAEGNYTVFARHKTAACSSDTATVTVNRIDKSIDVVIALNQGYSNCVTPNGALQASVTGQPLGNFTFAWYEGNDIFTSPQIGVSHIATGLKPLTYTVLVTDNATGCQAIESLAVPDQTQTPVPTIVVTNIVCSSANSGALSATINGVTAGFTFKWFNGSSTKPVADFTGSSYTNRGSGTYTLVVTNNTSQCSSVPETRTVSQTTAPNVTASATAPMTSCDASLPNGSATASVGGVTAGFTFEWYRGQNTLASNLAVTSPTATALDAGTYTVKAIDVNSGCFDTEEVTINYDVVTPSLVLGTVGDLTNCQTPNGSITVGVTLDTPSDYTFFWYRGTVVKVAPDFATTGNVLSGLTPGNYTVRAVHNTKNCLTAPIVAVVGENTPAILIDQVASITQLPTDCNSNNGVMGVTVSAPGNTLGFRIEWFKNNSTTAFFVETGVSASTAINLGAAVYRVQATNLNNGCSAEDNFDLPYANAHVVELVSKDDAITCVPQNEGAITVRLIPSSATSPFVFSVNDYEVRFYAGSDDSTVPIQTISGGAGAANGDGTSNYTIGTLTPGLYTIVAIETTIPPLSGCKSVPVTVEIINTAVDPVITASTISNNTNCTGVVVANGQIVAVADAGNPADYTFSWFDGNSITSPPLGTTSGISNNTADDLDAGFYTVLAVDNSTQCDASASFQIFNNPPVITITDADLTLNALTRCDVVNTSAAVGSIRENGVVLPSLAGFTFEWFNQSLTSIGTTNPISNFLPGTHFVQVTNTVNNCSSALIEFEIEDQTIGSVTVALTDFTEPTRCLKPTDLLGELVTTPGGNSVTGYTLNWYVGATVAGAPISNNSTLSGITIAPGLTSITHTIEVLNNSNQCVTSETYVLPLNQAVLSMTASAASPMTSCIMDNGVVFATITSGSSNDYTYNWHIGNTVTATPDFTGKQVNNLPIGSYTVQAIDNADNFCAVGPMTVIIEDGRQDPIVTALEAAPLTVCDITRPDGSATVSVGGNVTNYTFEWFVGNAVSGTPFYTGVQAAGLAAQTYTVQATDLITGCQGEGSVLVTSNILTIPNPTVVVVSNVTACDPNVNNVVAVDNGALSASINGNSSDYIFDWSNGTTATTPVDFTGEIYSDLAAGSYTVIATSRITGCISGPTIGQIVEELVLPDFDFNIINASCDQDNGFVSFNLLTDLSIATVEWSQNGSVISTEPVLLNVPEGVYNLRVRTSLGCPRDKDVAVGTEIRPFNGVSRNGDGKNDLFAIACIESFPTNLVKIFNRAGTLVYEAPGYDNIDVYFDGKSNKGISPLGNNLPDGTYFYVIDKGNGSKPLAGYLEIVN